jgi:hypothetical protein
MRGDDMPRKDLIDMKLNRIIKPMISDLRNNVKVVDRVGGSTVKKFGEEIKMQEERLSNLQWASTVTDTDIEKKITELSATLTSTELACKYGSVRALSLEKIKTIALIEDLEISLGTHPGVK